MAVFITNWGKNYKEKQRCYKVWQVLPQNRGAQLCFITKWGKVYYNVRQVVSYKLDQSLLQNETALLQSGADIEMLCKS